MLRVATFLKNSRIHGVGVFAAELIPAGTVIWDFTPGVDWRLAPAELEAFPEPFQGQLRHYTYLDESGGYILCGDNARFMNHSAVPNCDDRGAVTRASRDIHPGEELTCDYAAFDLEFREEELSGASLPGTSA